MTHPLRALAALVAAHGDHIPLDRGAALIAADDRPDDVDVDAVVDTLDRLGRGVFLKEGAPLFESLARLRLHLFGADGFVGDAGDYHALDNSWIDRVLERRKGMPITLSVVLMEVARRAGLDLRGVGFPGHFLVAPPKADPPFWVDAFRGGIALNEDDLKQRYLELGDGSPPPQQLWARFKAPVTSRQILVRINNNLKQSHGRLNDAQGALRAVERNLVLDPSAWHERRDRGLLLLQMGLLGEGRESLRHYLAGFPEAPDAARVRAVLDRFRPGDDLDD